ncbi:hypothetical protein WN51_09500 [Melipona quadrifasciata]|uniref:Uncharacterized protein n=1 Tax=Melipona quadrifasciata TaxID=166423 RepID=A0A0N0BIY7_9HYME|nr:hypothetical protein WN51_09500 [Melipona quadrifasciata]
MLLTENLGNAPMKAVPVMYDQSDPREKVLSLRNTVVAGDCNGGLSLTRARKEDERDRAHNTKGTTRRKEKVERREKWWEKEGERESASSGRLSSRNSQLNGHSEGYTLVGWLTARLGVLSVRLVVLLVRRFWRLFSLRLLSLLTLGFSTPADHDLAERSAKQYQDDSRLPAAPLSTSLSSLSPSYTVTLAYNPLTKQPMHIYRRRRDTRVRVLSTDPPDSARCLGAARSRLRQPGYRNFDENERRTGHCHPITGIGTCIEDGSSRGWSSSLRVDLVRFDTMHRGTFA